MYATKTLLGCTVIAATLIADHAAQANEQNGEFWIQSRTRFEQVDQDGFAKDAQALTSRLRIGGQTGSYQGWSFFGEFDHIAELGDADYFDGVTQNPNRRSYPTIADPKGTDLNQAFVQFQQGGFQARLGRQKILHGNQRFVGAVGWRQHEQTYDALRLTFNLNDASANVDYTYIDRVKRIFGQQNDAGRHDHNSHLLRGSWKVQDGWGLAGYWYGIDNDDAARLSTSTVGANLTWKMEPRGDWQHQLFTEVAYQQDYGNNPQNYSSHYLHTKWQSAHTKVQWQVGFERLDGDANQTGQSFVTPLATLHAFNGWADVFLATPDAGLRDAYAGVSGNIGPVKLGAVYHDFATADGGNSLGQELDVSAAWALNDAHKFLVRAARFDGDRTGPADRTKFWLMWSANWH